MCLKYQRFLPLKIIDTSQHGRTAITFTVIALYFFIKDDNIYFIFLFTYFVVSFYILQYTKLVQMVKECLRVSIIFKTDMLAPHNDQLVLSNPSYVEYFFRAPTTSTQRSSAVHTLYCFSHRPAWRFTQYKRFIYLVRENGDT